MKCKTFKYVYTSFSMKGCLILFSINKVLKTQELVIITVKSKFQLTSATAVEQAVDYCNTADSNSSTAAALQHCHLDHLMHHFHSHRPHNHHNLHTLELDCMHWPVGCDPTKKLLEITLRCSTRDFRHYKSKTQHRLESKET